MEDVQTRKRVQRGVASFKSKILPGKYRIKFNKNNIPKGGMSTKFMSWYGMMVPHRFPTDIATHKLDEKYYKDLRLEAKVCIFLIYCKYE